MEQKTWQVYNFGKRNVFRLDLNESRERVSVGEEGEGHSMLMDRKQRAESVYLVLYSLLDWKPVEKLTQRCYVGSFTLLLLFLYEASSTVVLGVVVVVIIIIINPFIALYPMGKNRWGREGGTDGAVQ